MLDPKLDRVAVLDFGGQYAHLIANRVRALGVYCVVLAPEDFRAGADAPAGLILSGGPQSVTDEHVSLMRARRATAIRSSASALGTSCWRSCTAGAWSTAASGSTAPRRSAAIRPRTCFMDCRRTRRFG